MGNGLDTKDTFALGIDLQGQLAAMELEHRQIVRGSLERDFPFGRRFVPRAIFRTTFVSEDCLDLPQVQRVTSAGDECLKNLLQVPSTREHKVPTFLNTVFLGPSPNLIPHLLP